MVGTEEVDGKGVEGIGEVEWKEEERSIDLAGCDTAIKILLIGNIDLLCGMAFVILGWQRRGGG